MTYGECSDSQNDSISVNATSLSSCIDKEENQQHTQDPRFDVLFEEIKEWKRENAKLHTDYDDLQKQLETQKKITEDLRIQLERQNNTTKDLQSRFGNTNIFESQSCDECSEILDTIDVELLHPSFSTNKYNNNDDYDRIQNVVYFDIPTFFCCFWRFSYTWLYGLAVFESMYFRHHTLVYYMTGLAIALSTLFEMIVEKLNGKVKKMIFTVYTIGCIIFWIGLEKFHAASIQWLNKSLPIVFVGGIIIITTEIILVIHMIKVKLPKTLILSHTCHSVAILNQLFITLFVQRYVSFKDNPKRTSTFFVLVLLTAIFVAVHPFLMLLALPSYQSKKLNQNKTDCDTTKQLKTNNVSSLISNVENEDVEEPILTSNDKTITEILHELQQRVKYLEAQPLQNAQLIQSLSFDRLQFRPMGINEDWTTKAKLSPDVYTMIMLSNWTKKSFHVSGKCKSIKLIIPRPSKSWLLGFIVFLLQTMLACFTLVDQMGTEFRDTPMNIPFRVTSVVRVGQFITLILAVMTQTDVLISLRLVLFLRYEKNDWCELIGHEKNERSFSTWIGRILLPNLMKSFQGLLVLVTTFIVIVQSNNIVDLLKDFTALLVISAIDDMFFFMADHGYLGESLSTKTNKAKQTLIDEDDKTIHRHLHLFLFVLLFAMFGGWMTVVLKQRRGSYLSQKYPDCPPDIGFDIIGDNKCDNLLGVGPNIIECGYEGGDCDEFNLRYPNCNVDYPYLVGNGLCYGINNSEECGYDGGDCIALNNELHKIYPNCSGVWPPWIGNGVCQLYYNKEECGFDGGDCNELNKEFNKYPRCKVKYPFFIGDGICHGGEYITEECGFDGGDCANCTVDDLSLLGNGECDGGIYNTKECGFDFGDCLSLNYPDCTIDAVDEASEIGNGYCLYGKFNTPECGYDGGDCEEFNKKYPKCKVRYPGFIGNGLCSKIPPYNTKECGYDGGDC